MSPRRTALQLTPLLDLLLIVIFAQYLDVGARDRKLIAESESLNEQLRIAEVSAREATARADRADRDAFNARLALDVSEQQRRSLAQAAASLFELPSERIEQMLSPSANPQIAETPEERAAVRQRLEELTSGNADSVVFHLLTHEELRKRVDLWRLHIDDESIASLDSGERTHRFRVEPDSLVRDLGLYVDTLPDPKRLVLVLFTYEEASRLITIEAVRDQLPRLMERFAQNSDSRFDYADLGFGRYQSQDAAVPPAPVP